MKTLPALAVATALWLVLVGALSCSRPAPGPTPDSRTTQRRKEPSGSPRGGPAAVLVPPDNARHLCGLHDSGAPLPDGRPGAHIIWDAYSSEELPAELSTHYRQSLAAEVHSTRGSCDTWRFPPAKPTRILEVCPVTAEGPWSTPGSGCSPPPQRAKSIILIASIARSD
jgi:hypothetical protein